MPEHDTPREHDWLAERFEARRSTLHAIAYRMLGSRVEAEDAVQDTWLRLHRVDAREVDNLDGWLRTVLARVCLDVLRARTARREESLEPDGPRTDAAHLAAPADAEHEAQLADAVGLALLVVLERLAPGAR
jgi:RNA polymerase sigma-70 factor, ECF subfamily